MLIGQSPYIPVGEHEQDTTLSTVSTITTSAGTSGILVQAITQNIRMIIGGSKAPTASLGFRLIAGDPFVFIPVKPGTILKFIEETASAVLQYQEIQRFTETVQ